MWDLWDSRMWDCGTFMQTTEDSDLANLPGGLCQSARREKFAVAKSFRSIGYLWTPALVKRLARAKMRHLMNARLRSGKDPLDIGQPLDGHFW